MSVTDSEAAGTAVGTAPAVLTPRLRLVLVLLLAAQFMLAVDFSILNVALPVIGDGLGFSLAHLQWIGTAFALCAAGFTLLFGFGSAAGSSSAVWWCWAPPHWSAVWPRTPRC